MNKTKTPDSTIYRTRIGKNSSEISHKKAKLYSNKQIKKQHIKFTKKLNSIKCNGSENKIIDNSSQIIINMLNNTSNFTNINNNNNNNDTSSFPTDYKSNSKTLKKSINKIKTNNYLSRFNMFKNYMIFLL